MTKSFVFTVLGMTCIFPAHADQPNPLSDLKPKFQNFKDMDEARLPGLEELLKSSTFADDQMYLEKVACNPIERSSSAELIRISEIADAYEDGHPMKLKAQKLWIQVFLSDPFQMRTDGTKELQKSFDKALVYLQNLDRDAQNGATWIEAQHYWGLFSAIVQDHGISIHCFPPMHFIRILWNQGLSQEDDLLYLKSFLAIEDIMKKSSLIEYPSLEIVVSDDSSAAAEHLERLKTIRDSLDDQLVPHKEDAARLFNLLTEIVHP